jgi:acetate---CoA ligase (ADP-forming)
VILLRVSRLAADVHEIAELDLNPVIALAPGHGCRVVDARVKVRTVPSSLRRPAPSTSASSSATVA